MACGAAARAQSAPSADAQVHLGVASCAGSTCHGAASRTKSKSNVVQNEYLIWQQYDKHARAYSVLTGALGRRIAANLGIGPAEKAEICLTCHTDNVPKELRGVQFRADDGVGCEACHGGAQKWLGQHVSGRVSHDDLVANFALYPTDRPASRATLCLSCHQGDADRFITHQIMGAGHPRLSFELQTYTQIEPAHFVIDDKYRARKTVAQGVQVWATGQAFALRDLATEIASGRHHGDGVFPELVFFDCQSCHHTTSQLRWQRRASTGLKPGTPHLNDANAVILRALAARVDPALSRKLEVDVRALHQALSGPSANPAAAARAVADDADAFIAALGARRVAPPALHDMIRALAALSDTADASDYAAAEQVTMGFASIIYTLQSDGAVTAAQYTALRAALEACYAATRVQDAYDPVQFAAAARAVAQAAP